MEPAQVLDAHEMNVSDGCGICSAEQQSHCVTHDLNLNVEADYVHNGLLIVVGRESVNGIV